jgi:NAD(P)-dependent dehydrogenase (short-subunit alcohol dehydrogenase family)
MGKLDGKVALVTGGSSGIGLAAAKRLVADGAHVFITGRRKSELDAAVEHIGPSVTAVQGDVSNLADLDRLFAIVKEVKGRIDILFANAGIAERAPLGEISEEHFDRLFGINVKGTLFTVKKALPLLSEGASIILTSSVVGSKGFASRSVYSATKAILRANLDHGPQGSKDPGERHQPWRDRYPGASRALGEDRRGLERALSRQGPARSRRAAR